MGNERTIDESLDHFQQLGYQFEPSILALREGVVRKDGQHLVYVKANTKIAVIRYTVELALGRVLLPGERVSFKRSDEITFKEQKDYRLTNLHFKSAEASAAELHKINQEPIAGYSHCLCGCGERLQPGSEPRAYVKGHSPPDKRRAAVQAAALDQGQEIQTEPVIRPIETASPITGVETYRPLFEAMIHELSWSDFTKILETLMAIKRGT